jgi:hypothetical protein
MAVLSSNVIAYYAFEESSGAFIDNSPNGYDPTNVNSVASLASPNGKQGNCASFTGGTSNGSAPYLVVPTTTLQGREQFGLSCWVYITGGSNWQRLLNLNGSSAYIIVSAKGGTGNQFGAQLGDSAGAFWTAYGGSVTNNTWYHIVANFGRGGIGIFINGSLIATSVAPPPNLVMPTISDIWIGRSGAPADSALTGRLDEWILFDRPLTSAEVTSLYNANSGLNQTNSNAVTATAYDVAKAEMPCGLSPNNATQRLIRTGLEAGRGSTTRPTTGQLWPRSGVRNLGNLS